MLKIILLIEEIKDINKQINREINHVHGLEDNIIEITITLKFIYRCNVILTEHQKGVFF